MSIQGIIGTAMKKPRIRPALIFKVFIALFMLGAIYLIVQNFVSRSRLKPKVPVVESKIAEQKVETTEKIQHFQLRKGNLEVRAARHYIGQDGLYHLEGDVQLTFPGRADGEDIVLEAREIVHDRENAFFRMLGAASMKAGDLRVESESLEYQTEQETLRTDFPVRFFSDRISGSAKKAVYRAVPQRLILREEVDLRMTTASDPSRIVQIQGDELDYLHTRAAGTIRGDARIDSEGSFARASLIRFELFADKENLKSIFMQGDAHIVMVEQGEADPEDTQQRADRFERRELRAQKIVVRAWHSSQTIRSLEAEGKCYMRQEEPGGEFIEIEAERLDIDFNRKGGLKELQAKGRVTMAEQRGGESRTVRGGTLSLKGRNQVLRVESGDESRARIKAGDYEIEADSLDIRLDSRNLTAAGGINVILTSPQAGDVKVWQGKETLMTQEMTIIRELGRLTCSKGVETHITVNPKDEEEYELEITAETLDYRPDDRQLNYTGEVTVKVETARLKADRLNIHLSEKDNKIQSLLAQGEVRITRELYEARGQEAVFDLEKETIILKGNPILTHQQKGRVRGDKLTFYLADDRIVVENRGRERSETIIKK
jgi:lipopolysaccharide transport protein LptA